MDWFVPHRFPSFRGLRSVSGNTSVRRRVRKAAGGRRISMWFWSRGAAALIMIWIRVFLFPPNACLRNGRKCALPFPLCSLRQNSLPRENQKITGMRITPCLWKTAPSREPMKRASPIPWEEKSWSCTGIRRVKWFAAS